MGWVMTRGARLALLALALLALLALALLAGAAGGAAGEPEAGAAAPGSITFVGRNALLKADGRFLRWRLGRVEIDREHPETGVVEVEVEIASIDTGIGKRDDHLRSADFFDVARFPLAAIRVHHARASGRSERGNPRYTAEFEIRIRDVTKTLNGDFEVLSTSPPRVEGSLVLNRRDFGIGAPYTGWNPLSIQEEIPVGFTALLPERP